MKPKMLSFLLLVLAICFVNPAWAWMDQAFVPVWEKTPAATAPDNHFTNSIGMTFAYIAPGSFNMGSPENEPGRDKDETMHPVELTHGYYMQTTEVTQGQWQTVMHGNPSYFKNCGENCPVESVSWEDAQKFIDALNRTESTSAYRLPTEAEWEYACRAGGDTAFANGIISEQECGNDANLSKMGWYCGNSGVDYSGCRDIRFSGGPSCGGVHPVGQKDPNAQGLYDMHGNVWEWCADRYGAYPSGAVTDPKGPETGNLYVYRGGAWNTKAANCRSAERSRFMSTYRNYSVGFRLARDKE